jgi:hypothetical protein
MAGIARELPRLFLDVCVIYPSPEEKGMWVAHSIQTDQIGVGDCVLNAYVELVRAVNVLLVAAEEDPTIQVFGRAPEDVCKRLLTAKELPREILEIAEMQLTGRFPVTLERSWKPPAESLSAPVRVYA